MAPRKISGSTTPGKAGDRDRIKRRLQGAGTPVNIRVARAICRVFPGQYVGFLVGFLGLPDPHLISVINELEVICRVCRVFLGVESSGEFGERKNGVHRRRANMTAPASVLDSTWTPEAGMEADYSPYVFEEFGRAAEI